MPTFKESVDRFDREFERSSRGYSFVLAWVLGVAFFGMLVAVEYYSDPPKMQKARNLPTIFEDPATGCQYLVDRGMTPRLGADGTPLCVKRSES